MSKAFEARIRQVINERTDTEVFEIMNGKKILGKNLQSLYLVVKVAINLPHEGFCNMDVCYVLGETHDGKLVIKRIEDNHKGIVDKKHVRFPEWKPYDF